MKGPFTPRRKGCLTVLAVMAVVVPLMWLVA